MASLCTGQAPDGGEALADWIRTREEAAVIEEIGESANLPRLLGLLHREGPRTRAQLTAATGLNRSTIASIVSALDDAGLVTESNAASPGRVGRPSPLVTASDRIAAIAVNPEVDGVRIAAIGLDRSIVARSFLPRATPPTPQDVADEIARTTRAWQTGSLARHRLVGVGIAVPGLVRSNDGCVRNAPHLAWHDAPLADMVERATGLPARAANDARLGAIAELRFGAGAGHSDLVYLNGGPSGIGGGIVTGGRLLDGASGYAGEFGHMIAPFADPADRHTPRGVLEDEIAPRHLAKLDGSAREAEIERQLRVLASTLAGIANVFNPATVILGGTLARLAARGLSRLQEAVVAQSIRPSATGLSVQCAALGEDRLLLGASELAFARLLRDDAWPG